MPPSTRSQLSICLTTGLILGFSNGALAQEEVGTESAVAFGQKGQLIIGAERVTGLVNTAVESEQDGDSQTDTSTTIGLLSTASTAAGRPNPFAMPRLTLDYAVAERITIGGALFYMSQSTESEVDAGGQSDSAEGPTTSVLVLAPRAGYVHHFSPSFGIWPRAGFTYFSVKDEAEQQDPMGGTSTVENTWSGITLSVDGMFFVQPIPHVSFLFGPTVDFGISGSLEQSADGGSSSVDTKAVALGVQAGLTVWW